MTNKEIAVFTLDALKKAGADHAQCVVTTGLSEEIDAENSEFTKMISLFDAGVAMKAIKDGKKGTMFINSLNEEDIIKAAEECVAAANASVVDDAVRIAELTENKSFEKGVLSPDKEKFFFRIKEYVDEIKKTYPQIVLEQLIADYSCAETVFMNTNGVEFNYKNGYYSLTPMFSAHDGEKTTSFIYFEIAFTSLEDSIIELAGQRDIFDQTVKLLDAEAFTGKFEGQAIIVPSCLADFISMAVGNFVSDGTIIDGTSPWRNMLGQKVASDCLTLSVNPLDECMVVGERITDDGYISENYDIIKNGVLESFCLSDYAARKTGESRAKNSSSCYVVAPGEQSLDEIIKSTEKGILVCRFSGGSPAINGDFSGVAKNSFLIENGRISKPITETMISGNIAAMLKNISGISKEVICDGHTKLPWIRFDGITVSGKVE